MKREKKKKLNKKDRFKEVKKAPVPMHSAPLFIKNIYGIETITDMFHRSSSRPALSPRPPDTTIRPERRCL